MGILAEAKGSNLIPPSKTEPEAAGRLLGTAAYGFRSPLHHCGGGTPLSPTPTLTPPCSSPTGTSRAPTPQKAWRQPPTWPSRLACSNPGVAPSEPPGLPQGPSAVQANPAHSSRGASSRPALHSPPSHPDPPHSPGGNHGFPLALSQSCCSPAAILPRGDHPPPRAPCRPRWELTIDLAQRKRVEQVNERSLLLYMRLPVPPPHIPARKGRCEHRHWATTSPPSPAPLQGTGQAVASHPLLKGTEWPRGNRQACEEGKSPAQTLPWRLCLVQRATAGDSLGGLSWESPLQPGVEVMPTHGTESLSSSAGLSYTQHTPERSPSPGQTRNRCVSHAHNTDLLVFQAARGVS